LRTYTSALWVRHVGSWRSSRRILLLIVVVQHVGQNILGVLQPFRHLCVIAIECLIQRHGGSLALLVDICYIFVFRIQKYLSVILEVNLDDLVAQSEHNCMLGPHPFLDINAARWILQLVRLIHLISLNQLFLLLRIIVLFQIRFEVLEESNFLLDLLREVVEAVLGHHVLFFVCSDGLPLIIIELGTA